MPQAVATKYLEVMNEWEEMGSFSFVVKLAKKNFGDIDPVTVGQIVWLSNDSQADLGYAMGKFENESRLTRWLTQNLNKMTN